MYNSGMINLAELYVRNHRHQQYMIVGGIMLSLLVSLAPRSERALFVTGNRTAPKAFAAIAPPAAFNGIFDDSSRALPRGYRLNTPRRGARRRGAAPGDFTPVDTAGVTPGGLSATSGQAPVQVALLDPSAVGPAGFGSAGRSATGAPLAGAGPATFGPGATATGPATPGAPVTPGNGGTTTPVVPVGAVPEPATWATMLLGFFGMGALLRRRSRSVSSVRRGRLQI